MRSFTNEQRLKEWFVQELEEVGWETDTEVWSDCESCRADVIATHPELETIGFELKLIEGRTGGAAADAMKQVTQYRDAEFDGERITLWAVAPVLSSNITAKEMEFMRSIITNLGFGYVDISHYRLVTYFAMSSCKIPLRKPEKADLLSRIKRRTTERYEEWH